MITTLCAAKDIDVRLIRELLGRTDIKTTLRNTHVSQQTIQKIQRPLDLLFRKKYDKNGRSCGYNEVSGQLKQHYGRQ